MVLNAESKKNKTLAINTKKSSKIKVYNLHQQQSHNNSQKNEMLQPHQQHTHKKARVTPNDEINH